MNILKGRMKMAKDRIYKDCPVCGAIGSMQHKNDLTFEGKSKLVGEIKLKNLHGFLCKECKEGFFDIASKNKISQAIADEKAKILSNKLKISEIVDVNTLVKVSGLTRQMIHSLMKEGKIPYVYAAGKRTPIKETEKVIRERYSKLSA